MEVCAALVVLSAVVSVASPQNQPVNAQGANANGNAMNVNDNALRHQMNLLRQQQQQQQQQAQQQAQPALQQVQQNNYVKQFDQKQDHFAQQNLAGVGGAAGTGQVWPAKNGNSQPVAQQHVANQNPVGNQQLPNAQNLVVNQNPNVLNQNGQVNNIPGGVARSPAYNIQAHIVNSGYVKPQDMAGANNGQSAQANQQKPVYPTNQVNNVNQVNQVNTGGQVNNGGQVYQRVQTNNQGVVERVDTVVNTGNSQGRDDQVKEEVRRPVVAGDSHPGESVDQDSQRQQTVNRAQEIAEDDRRRSQMLEQPVNTGNSDAARGVIRTVNDQQDNSNSYSNNNNGVNMGVNQQNFQGGGVNVNNQQQQYHPPPEREIGGIRLTWDWSDFAITFDDYGGAEMKVRRAPHATTGEPWPLPQYYVKKEKRVFKLDKDLFTFKVVGETCDIIQDAVERYRIRVLEDAVEDMYDNLQNAPGTNVDDPVLKYDSDVYTKANVIAKVDIKIRKPCTKYPSVSSDESYDLVVKKSRAFIWANEVWGALRGLETFSHIVWRGLDGEDPDDRAKNANLFVKETVISDYPRFPHRGVLIDSSRHFFFKETIFDILDGMEQNKMNVLHWHIIDDQSFPYQSEVFPELSKKGAFHPTFVYTQKDITEIIDYARFRGIRVMPEFDTPGHTYSWGLSRPDLLTQCYQGGSPIKGYLGPIDPSKNSTYRFLRSLFAEVLDTFKDQYIHLGGDEVPLGCWQSNPDIVNFGMELMKQEPGGVASMTQSSYNNGYYGASNSFDVRKVYEYYENRLIKDLKDLGQRRGDGVKFVMWQEVMNNNLQLPNDTIIEVWMGDMADVNRAISMGYQVLYATCWYLDHVEYGTKWPKYYQCDPADNTFGYMIDEKRVLGGEACLWSEYIDNENMMTTLWPRASAVAERLWSAKEVRDLDTAGARLSEHRCRMLNRGLSVAQISGPDYCLKRGIGRSRDKYRTNSTCTSGRCVKSRDGTFVEIDSIDIQMPRRRHANDCAKVSSRGGTVIFLATVVIVMLALVLGMKTTSGRLAQPRMCRNRTILFLFLGVLCIYFMTYTSIWMQAFDFSASNHKNHEHANVKH